MISHLFKKSFTTICFVSFYSVFNEHVLVTFVTLVGPSGLEPPTSCLSGTRSNLLSYEPMWLVRSDLCHLNSFSNFRCLVEMMGFDSRANCALGLPRSQTSTGSFLCTDSPSNPLIYVTNSISSFVTLVEMMGFEPMTPCLQGRCSPSWATPPFFYEVCFSSPFSWP